MTLDRKQKTKQFAYKLKNIVLPVVAYGGTAGIFAGILVSLFNLGASKLSHLSVQIYSWFSSHPAYIPLLFAGLIGLALLMYFLHKRVPQVKGSGIPQTEGVLRGLVTFKWLRILVSTIVGSYISFFAGLSLGSEGPSVQIGATTANGVSNIMKSRLAWQRYVITGGASAGLAVAFNAPLTGIIFALEEAHRRFTPIILLNAASSVVFGTLTYRLLSKLWGVENTYLFNMGKITPLETNQVWLLLIVGIVCGVAAIFFNWSLIRSQRYLDKHTKQFPYWARLILVFVLTGIVGLFLIDANGGGHDLIIKISSRNFVLGMLFILLFVKWIMILFCYNSGATGGLFIPMLAIGALLGGVCAEIFVYCGLSPEYYKAIVCIAMTTFFGASVRAPITAIILIVEITGYSSNFLSCAVAIFSAYLVAELLGNRPIYDSMLERYCEIENKGKEMKTVQIEVDVELGAFLINKCVYDVLWPANCLVLSIVRDEKALVPDGETRIEIGDKLVIQAETYDSDETYQYIKGLIT